MKYLCIATLLVMGATGCSEKPKAKEPIIRSVRYALVQGASDSGGRMFSGTVQAGNQSRLAFQVPGRLQKVHVKAGDKVKKGQLIAQLDPVDFKLQLGEAQSSAAQARAQSTNAKANYKRLRALYENQNASRQDLDAARAAKDSAQSAASAAYQAVQRIKRQLQYATLKAPGDGTIVECSVEANEVVGSGKIIAVLQVGEQMEVAVGVPETAINDLKRGDTVKVKVPALGEAELSATIYEIGIPRSGGAVFPVNVRFEGAPAKVRVGMAAQVTFAMPVRADDGSRVVPASAVGEDREGRFVYVITAENKGLGKVSRRSVEVGSLEVSGIRILSGLKDGDKVVTAGVSRISDGLAVRVPKKPGALR